MMRTMFGRWAENPKFERRKEPKRMGAKKSFMRRGLNRKDAKTRRF